MAALGWSQTDVNEFNKERFDDLVTAGWDLIIVDESHRIGGSSEQVARHQLGRGLSEASPYLLLLSATPHQGKTDAFHRLVSLLDKNDFPEPGSVTRERIHPYVIRTEKRRRLRRRQSAVQAANHQAGRRRWEGHQTRSSLLRGHRIRREGNNQASARNRLLGFLMI